ncbi:2-amino-4-hydroxy-6-hydroxymethyldihydropteridine diphosphokinase [Thioclava sediminum]|uniref:2-amino-4-hydroxy-6-hydroxymethyldihydropteridine pyrophosphokinase n=1 Tax=Thioclava sediminum TaxID=1915319 RepID=A0ABX3MUJ1_9RHOB|nr:MULTISPECIES: 2-amino-4-hydroxy-6-hydroxymethyldihydropteridine diphosphokinase [Thioclava]OOY23223.1 2-amino-4-hydroxy-6-hydroxymethyldihydropteridine diphosphokinase [Thioclava sediminum]OOY29968.1 2-amino-4-hydroxy-6-hydroxymethyldihydropteridine diphosphokinase [Thioclava sp. F36-6]
MDTNYLVAFGANLPSQFGSPRTTLCAAIERLEQLGFSLVAASRFWSTPAVPEGSGPDFVNACCKMRSSLQPRDALAQLHGVEEEFGRVREGRWSARVVDIDLIASEDRVLPDRESFLRWKNLPPEAQQREAPTDLILPHPRLQDRAFVLIPLAEIAPLWRHPITGDSVMEMLAALPEAEKSPISPL